MPEDCHTVCSSAECMLIIFCHMNATVHHEFILQGEIVNQHIHKEFILNFSYSPILTTCKSPQRNLKVALKRRKFHDTSTIQVDCWLHWHSYIQKILTNATNNSAKTGLSVLTFKAGYTHTYTHTYMHTYKHTHIHTYIQTHTYRCIHIHACIHTYTHTYIHTYIHAYIYTGVPGGMCQTSGECSLC